MTYSMTCRIKRLYSAREERSDLVPVSIIGINYIKSTFYYHLVHVIGVSRNYNKPKPFSKRGTLPPPPRSLSTRPSLFSSFNRQVHLLAMVNIPKTRRTYCKGKVCKKHTPHKVTQYKKGKDSLAAQGKRRYDRKFTTPSDSEGVE